MYSDNEKFTNYFKRGFHCEFNQINQLSINYPCLWRLIFATKFGDIFPNIPKLDSKFSNALYTYWLDYLLTSILQNFDVEENMLNRKASPAKRRESIRRCNINKVGDGSVSNIFFLTKKKKKINRGNILFSTLLWNLYLKSRFVYYRRIIYLKVLHLSVFNTCTDATFAKC